MTKKVNYFSHDFSARNDAKIISLRRKAGMEGFGIFWALVEMLYENWWELACDDESLENLAYEWRCEVEKIKIVIFDCNLFVVNWEKFYSKSINERMKKITDIREKKSEAWKKWMLKRWQKDNTSYNTAITDVTENITNAIENNNTSITEDEKPITENNKEINKKINKNTLNSLPEREVSEESPISVKTSDEKSVKSVLFKKFFEKFPKKSHSTEAEIAFISLEKREIDEISRVYPFWLNYWQTIPAEYQPNAYNWLFNKLWKAQIPQAIQTHPIAVQIGTDQTEKLEKNRQKQATLEAKQKAETEKKLSAEKNERAKILDFFKTLSVEKQLEITEMVEKKFAWKPVKKWDILWQIETTRLVKPMLNF